MLYLKNKDGSYKTNSFGDRVIKVPETIGLVIAVLAALIAMLMYVMPIYGVWSQGLKGQAELRRAEQNRRITVEEAQAKLDAAELLNQAEVARARGLSEATALVVDSFGGPDAYLRYLWIQSIENNRASVIYVPTEAGLPILEATRHTQQGK